MAKIIVIAVASIDGKIAKSSKDSIDWTSKEDRKFFSEVTRKAGVIVMGRTTYQQIGRVLPDRLNMVLTNSPKNYSSNEKNLEFTNKTPKSLIKDLTKRGFNEIMVIGGPTINKLFYDNNLVDEVWLTVQSVVLGSGVSLFGDSLKMTKAKLLEVTRLASESVLLKYELFSK